MTRTQAMLGGLLLVQVLVLLLTWGPSGGAGAMGGPAAFLPALADVEPLRIEIVEPAGEDGEAAESVVLQRRDEQWVLEQRGGYPADKAKVETMLSNLRELRVSRPVLTSSRYHEALEVDEDGYQRRVRIWADPEGDPSVDLILGSSPNYRIRHARLAGDERVYELRGLDYHDLRPESGGWIDKKLIDAPSDEVASVRVSNRHGSFELTRNEQGWALVSPASGGSPDGAEVDSFVRALSNLWIAEPAGPLDAGAQGLADPEATVEIAYRVITGPADAQDEAEPEEVAATELRTVTVHVGREADGDDAGKRYATRDGFGFAVLLAQYDAEKLTEQKLADLLAGDDS